MISPPVPGSRLSASRLSTHTHTRSTTSWTGRKLWERHQRSFCVYRGVLFIGVGVIKGRDLGRNKSAVCLCKLSLARERKKTMESSASSRSLSPCQTVSTGARRRAAGAHGRLRCAHEFYFGRLLKCFVTFSTHWRFSQSSSTTSHFTFTAWRRKADVFPKKVPTLVTSLT